jgi:GntR family transcriptional regulator
LPAVHRDTIHVTTKRRIRELIADRVRQGLAQLPAEEELAGLLGVSRATLRTALVSLQKEGLIRRRQGRGTFIQGVAARLTANLGQDRAFLDVIRECGHEAGARARVVGPEASDEAGVGSPALRVERVFTADGRPAVLAVDLVPLRLLQVPWPQVEPEASVFDFCAAWCGRPVAYSVAEIVPVAADPGIAATLEVEAGTPLLLLEHLHVAESDEVLARTRAYVNGRWLRFAVVRAGSEA